jgi:tetrapyrrole methylase family protein/MazG family protein/ATP diphosphatase
MKQRADFGSLAELLAIMAALRDRERGCPWDLEQTFATIAPYTIEEAYEVADAIERNDLVDLEAELGDLLFQVVFHARMAEEIGAFDFDDVAKAICAKMRRRHPHVFGDGEVADSAQQSQRWEEIKRAERATAAAAGGGVLDDVPIGLPALTRALKLGKRAASVGFDWPDVAGVRAKVDEELAETDAAVAGRDAAAIGDEIGDLLFSIANWCRHLALDPEACLRTANERFTRRFRAVEAEATRDGRAWRELDAAELERLWQRAKRVEQK